MLGSLESAAGVAWEPSPMPAPASSEELLDLIRKSGLVDQKMLDKKARIAGTLSSQPNKLAGILVRDGILTIFQAEQLLQGKWRPRNIVVDRLGTVKIVDFGLACFTYDSEGIIAKKYDERVLGTPDYVAPEQVRDCHSVDIRADIYGLGATFYFCLSGRPPFNGRTETEKLACQQSQRPRSIPAQRLDVPGEIVAIIKRMMAKDAAERIQTPQAVADSLVPWTRLPIEPPEENDMPQMSPAALMVISRNA
jgi:serine/threonine protein kinase